MSSGISHTYGLREDGTHACWFYDRVVIVFDGA